MTRADLAEAAGVSQATIGAWELGYRTPRPKQLVDLAAAIDAPIETLAAVLPERDQSLSALGELIQARQQRLGLTRREIAKLTR